MKPSPHEVALLVERFDFEKVAKVMELLRWQWHRDGRFFVPCADELRVEATRLANNLEMTDGYRTGTGGIMVEVATEEGGKLYLHLQFVLEHSDTEYL